MAEDWNASVVPEVNDAESGPLDVSPWSDKDPLRASNPGDLARASAPTLATPSCARPAASE